MPKVSGIDFSILEQIRETVSVKLAEDKVVELPLLPLRVAPTANYFLQRNDAIAVQYKNLQARLEHKSKMIKATGKLESKDAGFDAIDDAMNIIKDMYKRAEELSKENHELCNEIHEFIAPYLEGTDILQRLRECEDRYTIEILDLMLNGAKALERNIEADEKENPTTAQSQKS